MASKRDITNSDDEANPISGSGPAHYVLAFAVGTLVGMGIASIWVPKRQKGRLPGVVRRRYRRVRKAGGSTLDELRNASRELTGEFREEVGATLEAAREELGDIARQQLEALSNALRGER